MHGGGASQQTECGQQADEAEAVVAVQVGDEDMVQAGKFQARTSELGLAAFAAVDHE